MKTICRIASCLLVVIMLFAVVACSGNNQTTPTNQPTESKTPVNTGDANTTKTPGPTADPSGDTTPDPATPTPTPTPTPTDPDVLKKPEFIGNDGRPYEFKNGDELTEINFFLNTGEAGDTEGMIYRSIALSDDADMTYSVNKETQRRNDTVKEELGVDIRVKGTMSMQSAKTDLHPILASEEYVYDVFGLYQYFDLGTALKDTVGAFYNFENMPEDVESFINVNAPYWNKNIYDTVRLRDPETGNYVCFFLTGDITQCNIGFMYVSFVNKRLWADFASQIAELETSGKSGDIYEIINNGYWTLDLWMDLANLVYKDENSNERVDPEDRLGIIIYDKSANLDNMSAEVLSYGSHVEYTQISEDGTPVATVNNERNTNFFYKLKSLYNDTNCGGMDDRDGKHIMKVFNAGNAMMTVGALIDTEQYLSEMADDFYVLPLPMLDHDQFDASLPSKGYATGLGDSLTQFAISVDAGQEKLPIISATMELMGYYSKLWVTPSFYDVQLKERYSRDPSCKVMIDLTHEGIYATFGHIWSSMLSDITWWIRTNYDSNDLSRDLKQKQKGTIGKLRQLMIDISDSYFVRKYD